MSVEQEVPAWAKDAVAQGWTWFDEDDVCSWDTVRRTLKDGRAIRVYEDGSGGFHPSGESAYMGMGDSERSVSEALKLADEYAADNGGWA